MNQRSQLVESVGLRVAETVSTTVSDISGPICPRIPESKRRVKLLDKLATSDVCDSAWLLSARLEG
jgi:hypothetical protein